MPSAVRNLLVKFEPRAVATDRDDEICAIGFQFLCGRQIADNRQSDNLVQIGLPVIDKTDVIPCLLELSGFRHNGSVAARANNNQSGHEGFPLNGSIVT